MGVYYLVLFPGLFVTGLEYACDCKAEVVGKPEKAFFMSAIKDMSVSPEECVMIGDVCKYIVFWFECFKMNFCAQLECFTDMNDL